MPAAAAAPEEKKATNEEPDKAGAESDEEYVPH
jgi:hypothetical protein